MNAFKTLAILLSVVGWAEACSAQAQQSKWPTKPVRVVVPYGAGGSADAQTRLFSEHLGRALGQQFVVENRVGGGGLVGMRSVARSEPDGYTFGNGGMSAQVLAASLSDDPGFDPVKDFVHVALFGGAPSIIVAHPSIGVKSLQDMLVYARSQTDRMPYASTGVGAIGHILFQYIVVKEKLNAVAVQYRSGSATVVDLLAGRVKVGTLIWPNARQHVEAGNLVALAVSSDKRLRDLPNVPTLRELGYSELVLTAWTTLTGPAGMPKVIVDIVNREVQTIVQRADMKPHFDLEGDTPALMSSGELTEFVRAEVARWKPVVRPLAEAK